MNTYRIERYGHVYNIEVHDENLEQDYRKGHLCEQPMLDWIVANVPHGGLWVDAGANVGNHAMVFATACQATTVIAVEPVPFNYYRLLENTRAYGNIIPLRLGLGADAALLGITDGGVGMMSQKRLRQDDHPDTCVVALDHLVPIAHNLRLVKIDVEGMEEAVLWGMSNHIAASKPELFIEIWEPKMLHSISTYLARWGYKMIERWNHAPTYHFSASGRYRVTYTPPKP